MTIGIARDTERRVAEIADLQGFRTDYRRARRRFSAGKRKVLFPYGTYLLRARFGVRCRDPDCGGRSPAPESPNP